MMLYLRFLLGWWLLGITAGAALAGAPALGSKVAELPYHVRRVLADPARPYVYATTNKNSLLVINTADFTIKKEVSVGASPGGLSLSPDNSLLYVANRGSNVAGLSVIDLNRLEVQSTLPTPQRAMDVAVGAGGTRLYVLTAEEIYQLNSTTGAVQATLSQLNGQRSVYVYGGFLRITPDRKTLLYANEGLSPSSLWTFNVGQAAPTLRDGAEFGAFGSNGQDLILTPDGSRFVFPNGGGTVNYDIGLFSTANTAQQFGTFECGAYPTNGAFSPDGKWFYTAPDAQAELQVYDVATFVQKAAYALPSGDYGFMTTDSSGSYLFLATDEYYFDSEEDENSLQVYRVAALPPVTITSAPEVTLQQGVSGRVKLTANQTVSWSSSSLPAGLTLTPATGVITGKPKLAGNYRVTVKARSAEGLISTQKLLLRVQTEVTLAVQGSGSVTGLPLGKSWQYVEAPLTLQAEVPEFGAFQAWTGSVASPALTLVAVTKPNMVVQANFQPLLPITFTVRGPGSTNNGHTTLLRTPGTSLSLQALPEEGARFLGWDGPGFIAGNDTPYVVGNTPATLTAHFASNGVVGLISYAQGGGEVAMRPSQITTHAPGSTITLEAVPRPGSRFLGWVGASSATTPQVTVTLQEDTYLQADFESLAAYAGTYRLRDVYDPLNGPRTTATVTLSPSGTFTGALYHQGKKVSFQGSFPDAKPWQITLPGQGNTGAMVLQLTLPVVTEGAHTITGTLTVAGAAVPLNGGLELKFSPQNPTPLRGSYTLRLPRAEALLPTVDDSQFQPGYARMKISPVGLVKLTGRLCDGAPFTSTAWVGDGGQILLETKLPQKHRFLHGWLAVEAQTGQVTGQALWDGRSPDQQMILKAEQNFTGSRLPAVAATVPLLEYRQATFTTVLPGSLYMLGLTIDELNQWTTEPLKATSLKLKLDSSTGLLTGSFNVAAGKAAKLEGVVDYLDQTGSGQFRLDGALYSFTIHARPAQ